MLTEGFLATLVIIACTAGLGLGAEVKGELLTGENAWAARYASWSSAGALGAKVGAFVDGAANFLKSIGIPAQVALALMGVLVASFAGTTLDTACRLQRYVVQELAGTFKSKEPGGSNPLAFLQNKHGATLFAIVIAALVATAPAPGQADWSLETAGKGGMILWPLFGATNQLLAGLAFLVITFHLWRRGKPIWFLALPMVFMLIMPMWAMIVQLFFGSGGSKSWIESGNGIVVLVGLATIALEIWMLIEAAFMFPKAKGVLEAQAQDQPATQAAEVS